jgi:hypothetical protein
MEITLDAEYNPSNITQTIQNVTRSDLSAIPWFITELDKFIQGKINYSQWIISDENYSELREVFIELNIIKDSSGIAGTGSSAQSSCDYLVRVYLRFETKVIEVEIIQWCSSLIISFHNLPIEWQESFLKKWVKIT